MQNPNPNPNPAKDGADGGQKDPWEALKGQKDVNGVPKHPEEKADFYKSKSDSSNAEANRIIGENKTLTDENSRLKNQPPQPQGNAPYTGNELSNKIPDFNTLRPEQQTAILNSFGSLHNDLEKVKETVATMVDKQDFDKGYNSLIVDTDFAGLVKHKSEFITEAYKPENLKTALRTLAIAFLAEKGEWGTKPNAPANPKPADGNPDAGRSGLDGGTGGNQAPPSDPNTYTSKEVQELRKADPRKYMRLVRTKKLVVKD